MNRLWVVGCGLWVILFLMGCQTTPYIRTLPPSGMPGIYHKVEKGQTLWRISKIYDIDLEELAKVNRISNATALEIGQDIFIPNRQRPTTLSPSRYASDDFIWPLKGKTIAAFGQTYGNIINKGLNIAPYGNTDVVASRNGKIVFYDDNFGVFGKTIILDHADGFSTVYARNAEVFVRAGDNVEQGTVIAKAGSAGRDKNVYLHFEIRKGYITQNPYFYLP